MEDESLSLLLDSGIITADNDDEDIKMDKSVLVGEIKEKLEEAERVDIDIGGRQHRIAEIEGYEDNRLYLVLKSYSDDSNDNHRSFYRIIIPFRAQPDKFEKIYNIVLTRINYHEILTSDSPQDVVEYIVRAARRQMRFHQRMLLEKEARRSVNILNDYHPNPEEFREAFDSEAQAGYEIEDQLNVVFRYLFRDYLPGGGSDEPDGGLQLQDEYYLVDSKQAKTFHKAYYRQSNHDIKNSKYNDLVESDRMIYVISKQLLLSETKSGSLNSDARERVLRDEDSKFHYMSVEAVCGLYGIFSEHNNILRSSHDVRDDVFSIISEMIKRSEMIEDCDQLTKIENTQLGEIRRRIDRVEYIPEDEYRYF